MKSIVIDRHILFWDIKHNLPVQPGNLVLNPNTCALEAIGPEGCTIGPPAVDFYVHNIKLPLGPPVFRPFLSLRTPLVSKLEDILGEIGQHVREGKYEVTSLSASKYSVVLVLASSREDEDLGALFREMQSSLVQMTIQKSRGRAQGNEASNIN